MERLTKLYNEHTGTYEYIDTFSGAGIFDTIRKAITSKFVKNTAKTLGTKALEAGVNKVESEIGTRAANEVISVVDKMFSKPPPSKEVIKIKEVELDDENCKPLGNVIMKELNKKSANLTSPENLNAIIKKTNGSTNKQLQCKLNKLLN